LLMFVSPTVSLDRRLLEEAMRSGFFNVELYPGGVLLMEALSQVCPGKHFPKSALPLNEMLTPAWIGGN